MNISNRLIYSRGAFRLGLITVWIIAVAVSSVTGEEKKISLKSALDMSLKNNFSIRIARHVDNKIQNNKALGTGKFLPTVDALAVTRETAGNTPDLWQTGVDATWTIFDGFSMFKNNQLLRQKALVSQIEYLEKIERVSLEVIQAYFNCVTQTFLLNTSESQVEISRERLEKINFKKSLGTSSTSEQLNARVALNEDMSQVYNRKLQKLVALNSLKLLLGLKVSDSISVVEKFELPPIKKTLNEWLELTLKHNTRLSLLGQSQRIDELNLSLAKALYWPRIVLSGTAGYTGPNSGGLSTGEPTYSVAATLRLPLFAGFKNTVGRKNSEQDIKIKELEALEYTRLLESLVHQQWEVIQNTYQQVVFERDAVNLAKENLSLSRQQMNIGNIEGVAFREAQLSQLKAMTRLATSKFEARLAIVELERLAGQLRIQ